MKTILAGDRMGGVLFDVQHERRRQMELFAAQKFPYLCDDVRVSDALKLTVLAEEFGEAAREVNEIAQIEYTRDDTEDEAGRRRVTICSPTRRHLDAVRRRTIVAGRRTKLRAELIQVAAVCVAWCEALDAQEEERHERSADSEPSNTGIRSTAGQPCQHVAEKFRTRTLDDGIVEWCFACGAMRKSNGVNDDVALVKWMLPRDAVKP